MAHTISTMSDNDLKTLLMQNNAALIEQLAKHFAAQDAKLQGFDAKLQGFEQKLLAQDAKMDKRFAEQDAKMDKRFAEQDATLAAAFAKTISYLDARLAAELQPIHAKIDRIYNLLDRDAKVSQANEHERLAMSSQLSRHGSWIGQLAKATKTKLVPEQ